MQEKMKMEAQHQKSLSTLINDDDEQLAGYNCPVCGYPIVVEMGLELCYRCGWSENDEDEGYYDL